MREKKLTQFEMIYIGIYIIVSLFVGVHVSYLFYPILRLLPSRNIFTIIVMIFVTIIPIVMVLYLPLIFPLDTTKKRFAYKIFPLYFTITVLIIIFRYIFKF